MSDMGKSPTGQERLQETSSSGAATGAELAGAWPAAGWSCWVFKLSQHLHLQQQKS